MSHPIEPQSSLAFADTAGSITRKPPPRTERPPKPAPFSLRLSQDEWARLILEAGDQTLGAYIRDRLFGETMPKRRPVKDEQALAQALGQLGNSHLANNQDQLAKAANTGSLPVNRETEEALRQAVDDVHAMRQMLMRALGLLS